MIRMEGMDGLDELPLRRISTADQVAEGLTEMILSGKVAPGIPLREAAIAAQLGISRNTVREAVRILEQGGLVRRQEMHRGATVIEPSDEELAELHRVRHHLELAGAAATNTPEAVQAVRRAFDAMVAASEAHQLQPLVERDLAFHAAIVAQLNSKRIDAFYHQIARELSFFLMILSNEDREYLEPHRIISEHDEIMTALEAGDIPRAQALITTLIEENESRVRAIFQARRKK